MTVILDISQPLGHDTAAWPGDRAFALEWTMRMSEGDSVNVAALRMSAHAATHVDGPLHVRDRAPGAGTLGLEAFIGPAVVVDARGRDALDVGLLHGLDLAGAPRVLFRTRERAAPDVFPDRVAPVTTALAQALAHAGVVLLGTDAPSVDPVDSKRLDAHRALVAGGIAIVENLVLDAVKPGRYTFIGLPLRLTEADSSPVRAVLLEGT